MSLIKNLGNKKIFFLIFSLAVFLGIAAGGLVFSRLSSQLKNLGSEKQKISSDYKQMMQDYERREKENLEIKKNNERIQKEYEEIANDRNNLLAQIKNLLGFKNRVSELEADLETGKKENIQLQKDKDNLKKEQQVQVQEKLKLKEKIKQLETYHKKLYKEKEQLEDSLVIEREKTPIKRLEQEKASLLKENKDLSENLKKSQIEIGKLMAEAVKSKEQLNKFGQETKEWREKANQLNNAYAEAVKKNNAFEQKVMETPKRFAEIARQNKTLIKETANMHYNLGVFYTKNKEYSRALAEFEKTVELTPDDSYAHFNLGYIYAEYVVNRHKAIDHFRRFLSLSKSDDKDIDWVRKYILTWEAYEGKKPLD